MTCVSTNVSNQSRTIRGVYVGYPYNLTLPNLDSLVDIMGKKNPRILKMDIAKGILKYADRLRTSGKTNLESCLKFLYE